MSWRMRTWFLLSPNEVNARSVEPSLFTPFGTEITRMRMESQGKQKGDIDAVMRESSIRMLKRFFRMPI